MRSTTESTVSTTLPRANNLPNCSICRGRMLDEHFIASVEANEVKFSGEMTEAVFRAVAHEQLVFRIFRWVRETQAAE